ncbi:DUF1858 domain-containing protein [Candidatus Poribacteria bacterium]|nr:DUF1858 domain-containing protein [Candidatus Poribacteria bacterium]
MRLNPETLLSEAIEMDPNVLDFVVSLNPHQFETLYNPAMRRMLAGRTTLAHVAQSAGIPVAELLRGLSAITAVRVKTACDY